MAPPPPCGPQMDPELKKLRLPQLEIPRPKTKMKTLNWVKLPDNKVIRTALVVCLSLVHLFDHLLTNLGSAVVQSTVQGACLLETDKNENIDHLNLRK